MLEYYVIYLFALESIFIKFYKFVWQVFLFRFSVLVMEWVVLLIGSLYGSWFSESVVSFAWRSARKVLYVSLLLSLFLTYHLVGPKSLEFPTFELSK